MAIWSEIPRDIVRKIAVEHLDHIEDFEAFGGVCREWRVAMSGIKHWLSCKNIQLPWLMLVDPPDCSYRRLYSLYKGMFRSFDLPDVGNNDGDDQWRYFSSTGWLISLSRRNRHVTLFDPFSRTTSSVIKAPSVPLHMVDGIDDGIWEDKNYMGFFQRFAVSNIDSTDGFAVAMIFGRTQHLAFWRPGQDCWIKPVVDFDFHWVHDVCFLRGEFYAVDDWGNVMAFGSHDRPPRVVTNLRSQGLLPPALHFLYLAGGADINKLLVIRRNTYEKELEDGQDDSDLEFGITVFQVIEVDVSNGAAKILQNLDNMAVFVGLNSTFTVEAASLDKRGCRPNCIYFTDDYADRYSNLTVPRGGSDMGVYCLEQNKIIERVYQGPSQFCSVTPPLWVELPHSSSP